jgi:hypothetical protein
VTYPADWDPDALRAKSRVYFDRAFEYSPEDVLFAFWCHLAVELLARAAIASVNPALLAARRKIDSLLYGLGVGDADQSKVESVSCYEVYELCERLIPEFRNAERVTCEQARSRRNAELHTAGAAFDDLPRGWLGRFFAACRVLAHQLDLELDDLIEADHATLLERLIDEDSESVRTAVREAIDAAKHRFAELSKTERQRRARAARKRSDPLHVSAFSAAAQTSPEPPLALKDIQCPACKTPGPLRGEVVARNPARIDQDGQLVETRVALPTLFTCPVCELNLNGVAELAVAGLADPVTLTDYPDPVETFDVDLSDYHDEYIKTLAEDYAYQDE